jgi:hypothetical protein
MFSLQTTQLAHGTNGLIHAFNVSLKNGCFEKMYNVA